MYTVHACGASRADMLAAVAELQHYCGARRHFPARCRSIRQPEGMAAWFAGIAPRDPHPWRFGPASVAYSRLGRHRRAEPSLAMPRAGSEAVGSLRLETAKQAAALRAVVAEPDSSAGDFSPQANVEQVGDFRIVFRGDR